ncbi:hypothetical protein Avi_8076 (plasmid) [Allorhizobium ampelinum S4]|uniref:Uncharacterized protein n=2 Tax=Rhizobiaceae TaxID=82115 RepID=B9K4D1_ALLAM|nr:hypothetical protein Avi_8076 [Allorhizobium ampelinum S4]
MASWSGPGSPSINPLTGSASKLRPLRLRLRGDRDRFRTLTGASSGNGPLQRWSPQMNTNLSLAQNHAFQLSRTLMVPVTLFRTGDEFGVLPSDELDDEDDLEIVHEYVPGGSH